VDRADRSDGDAILEGTRPEEASKGQVPLTSRRQETVEAGRNTNKLCVNLLAAILAGLSWTASQSVH